VVQTQIENPISSLILKEEVDKGDTIKVDLDKDKNFSFKSK
jgi:ATP-dependent Clp protease ATP-binding subunit ClpA